MNEKIQKILSSLPDKPGVYIMHAEDGTIIYVGKAKNLKNRVKSYFSGVSDHTFKTQILVSNIADLEYIITASEAEAFILENSLIKKHKPRYNIMLKDDKTYPFIKLSVKEDFPRVLLVRKIFKDGDEYFGPYSDQWSVRVIIKLLQDVFNVRSCNLNLDTPKKRPCLNYFIGRCKGPCVRYISKDEYAAVIKLARSFLKGDYDYTLLNLKEKMQELSSEFKFEQAAKVRDQIRSIENIAKQQNIICFDMVDRDIIAEAGGTLMNIIEVFNVRRGVLLGHKTFQIDSEKISNENGATEDFMTQYYQSCDDFPHEIITTVRISDDTSEFIVDFIKNKTDKKVKIITADESEQKSLIATAHKNAVHTLKIKEIEKAEKDKKSREALSDIVKALGLSKQPQRIECYDISNISGTLAVGSMVVALNGEMAHSEYRKFKIKTVNKIDDYQMMKEVLTRRFKRAIEEKQKLPDLVMIDGGVGHLSAACEAITALGLNKKLALCSIAKQNEDIFIPANNVPSPLNKKSQGQFLLMRIRDEAHRFAITYHRSLRKGVMTLSVLSGINGMGQKRIAALYDHFETIDRIRGASVEELCLVKSITKPIAEKIYDFFHANS
ncbi:MAG: excinuclease ABC subunit UvrC [Candidatus Wallbacteria bacterium]